MSSEKLTPATLEIIYRSGYFPMGTPRGKVELFEPYRRALFPLTGIRVSRSLARLLRPDRFPFRLTFDQAFEEVMRHCLRPMHNWINEEIIAAFVGCHEEGWAHSCEVWREDRLVGGVYGLAIGACFSAESMFHRESNASKVALWALIHHCRELGFTIFDAQIMNPHLESIGAFEVSQREYLSLLDRAAHKITPWSR